MHHAWWDPATDPAGVIGHDLWTTDGSLVGDVTTLVTGYLPVSIAPRRLNVKSWVFLRDTQTERPAGAP